MNHVILFTLFLLFIFCTTSKGQTKTNLPTDTIRSAPKAIITAHGPTTSVRTIRQDRKGNIWLASNEGVFRYDGKSFTNITGDLSPGRFWCLVEDRKGNLWFGNQYTGVYNYDGKSLQRFTAKEGLANNQVLSMYEDKAGNIWFGGLGTISYFDGQSFRSFKTEAELSNSAVMTIMQDKTGRLWFGTGNNIFVYDGKTFAVFNHNDTSFSNVWSIIEDSKGNIWIGGGTGLWRFDGNAFTHFSQQQVGYVYEDKKGNIWTSGADRNHRMPEVLRYDARSLSNKKPTVTTIAQSLNLFGFLEANDGSIWFGAYDGVYRYDGNTVKDFKKGQQ